MRMHAFTTMRMYSIMFLYVQSFCQETIIMCSYNRMTSYSIAIRFDYNLLRFSLINSEQLEVIELNFHSLTHSLIYSLRATPSILYMGVEMEWMHIHEYLVRADTTCHAHWSSPLIAPDDSPCCATCEVEEEGRKEGRGGLFAFYQYQRLSYYPLGEWLRTRTIGKSN